MFVTIIVSSKKFLSLIHIQMCIRDRRETTNSKDLIDRFKEVLPKEIVRKLQSENLSLSLIHIQMCIRDRLLINKTQELINLEEFKEKVNKKTNTWEDKVNDKGNEWER